MALVKHCENEEPKPCIICQKLCDNTNSYNFLLSGYTNGDETEVICQDCYQFGYANRLTNMKVLHAPDIIFINETMITPLRKNIIISSTAINFGFLASKIKKQSGILMIAISPKNIN